MAFSDDNGGFIFSCNDAKMSICASTWNTRLSQLARANGPVLILTALLPDQEYIERIISKRPRDIFIVANSSAEAEAKNLKKKFSWLRISLHRTNNAKVVLVSPDTVWVSSSDFGRSDNIEAAVGLHSTAVFERIRNSLFQKIWQEAIEIV